MAGTPTSEAVLEHVEVFTPEYCHAVFCYFDCQSTETATVADLGTYISEQYHPNRDQTDIAIHLHHATLPALADAGLVEYDPRSQTARYTDTVGCNFLPVFRRPVRRNPEMTYNRPYEPLQQVVETLVVAFEVAQPLFHFVADSDRAHMYTVCTGGW